jgi:hypothetical protein
MRERLAALFLTIGFIGVALSAGQARANPISVNPASLYIFRDDRSVNDVGVGSGDRFAFGGDINGGSLGSSITGIFTPASPGAPFITPTLVCAPLAIDHDFCGNNSPFSVAHTNGSWQAEFKNGADTTTVPLPPVSNIPATHVPFPASVAITANGNTPTISWTLPANTSLNGFQVTIYDKSHFILNGQNQVIFAQAIDPAATIFTIPASAGLENGGSYAIQLRLIETRDGQPIPPSGQADFLTASSSFFDFSPPGQGSPPVIQLPMIGANGIYHFNVGSVGPNSVTFIDPTVATGYIYDIGQGDPNFASVLLPDVGGGRFDLSYLLDGSEFTTGLDEGIPYPFPSGGVSEFKVTGIDPSAKIDPTNGLSFITGLTFVGDGSFTGTMTPITAEVAAPEPGPLSLLGFGLAAMGLLRFHFRRRFSS